MRLGRDGLRTIFFAFLASSIMAGCGEHIHGRVDYGPRDLGDTDAGLDSTADSGDASDSGRPDTDTLADAGSMETGTGDAGRMFGSCLGSERPRVTRLGETTATYPSGSAGVLLGNGEILLFGSEEPELVDVETGMARGAPSPASLRRGDDGVLLSDDRALIVGATAAEIFDVTQGTWSDVPDPGELAFVGVTSSTSAYFTLGPSVSEGRRLARFDVQTLRWTFTASSAEIRFTTRPVELTDGRLLFVGGGPQNLSASTVQAYDTASDTWGAPIDLGRSLATGQTSVLLPDGQALALGRAPDGAPFTVRVDLTSGTAAVMPAPRDLAFQFATLACSDGYVAFAADAVWGYRGSSGWTREIGLPEARGAHYFVLPGNGDENQRVVRIGGRRFAGGQFQELRDIYEIRF